MGGRDEANADLGISQFWHYNSIVSTNKEIGRRVLDSLGTLTRAALADRVGMTPDAMSRATRGQRGFSSVELADIADVLGVDVYWLITGHDDPIQVQVAARHAYDHGSGKHLNQGQSADEQDLSAVVLAYRQAYPAPVFPSSSVPSEPAQMRAALGDDFVRNFADRVEERLGIDVVRLPLLSTAYSLTIGGRAVIVLPTAANWFRSNTDLAHEIGHLALGHHDAGSGDPANEAPANRFAADLLLPSQLMRQQSWSAMTAPQAARFLWETGVSGTYVQYRLDGLGLRASAEAERVFRAAMPGALRPHVAALGEPIVEQRGPFSVVTDPIDDRMKVAAQRRFPSSLIAAHRRAVEARRVAPATLAWMLDCGVDALFDDMSEPTTSHAPEDFSDFAR